MKVLDTSAILRGYIPEGSFTVAEVVKELKDEKSEFLVRAALESEKLSIREPSEGFLGKVRDALRIFSGSLIKVKPLEDKEKNM